MEPLLFSRPVWKDHRVPAMAVTSRIPHLPTDSCHLSFSHAGLSDNIPQSSSIHIFHHQPEISINKEAGRGKQRHGDECAELNSPMEKPGVEFCSQVTCQGGQNQMERHSCQAAQPLESAQSKGEGDTCEKGEALDGKQVKNAVEQQPRSMWKHNPWPQLVQLLNSSVPAFPPEEGNNTAGVIQGRRPCSTWDKSSQKTFQKVPSETGRASEKWANEAFLERRTWSSWHQ